MMKKLSWYIIIFSICIACSTKNNNSQNYRTKHISHTTESAESAELLDTEIIHDFNEANSFTVSQKEISTVKQSLRSVQQELKSNGKLDTSNFENSKFVWKTSYESSFENGSAPQHTYLYLDFNPKNVTGLFYLLKFTYLDGIVQESLSQSESKRVQINDKIYHTRFISGRYEKEYMDSIQFIGYDNTSSEDNIGTLSGTEWSIYKFTITEYNRSSFNSKTSIHEWLRKWTDQWNSGILNGESILEEQYYLVKNNSDFEKYLMMIPVTKIGAKYQSRYFLYIDLEELDENTETADTEIYVYKKVRLDLQ